MPVLDIDWAFVVSDKPLFVGLTEIILLADPDALKDLLHLFLCGGQKSVTLNDMDGEIAELMYKTVRKLEAMTDAEVEELFQNHRLIRA